MPLIARLFDGPIDVIGDVHGEKAVMDRLLSHLGYQRDGCHPEGRRLVFLGDLINRGPDSPAVLEAVMGFVEAGRAQCVIGNHELNILLGRPMHGNGWLIQPNEKEAAGEFVCASADPRRKQAYLDFLGTLPLALESRTLRVVHACWDLEAIRRLSRCDVYDRPLPEIYERFRREVDDVVFAGPLQRLLSTEVLDFAGHLRDPDWPAHKLPAHARHAYVEQMGNPIRVLTTSAVREVAAPYFASGKWRMIERIPWWEDYDEPTPVVIGHFWRQYDDAVERIAGLFGADVFEGVPPHAWMGQRHNVYCVDYSVGQLHLERRRPGPSGFFGRLAALRYPEWEIHHDDATVVHVGPPGTRAQGPLSSFPNRRSLSPGLR